MIGQRSTPQRLSGFAAVTSAGKWRLCGVSEAPEVRARHLAALLAFTQTVSHAGNLMRFGFGHGPTAMWVTRVLAHQDVDLVDLGSGTVAVKNPQLVLGRYGFREGRWVHGQGPAAGAGLSRGAVHAAASFDRHGMQIACPSAPMMITLTAVMSRFGIEATPTGGEFRALVSAGDVFNALSRLGIADVGVQYRDVLRRRASR